MNNREPYWPVILSKIIQLYSTIMNHQGNSPFFNKSLQYELFRIILKKTIGDYTLIDNYDHETMHFDISKIILAHKLKVLIELENLQKQLKKKPINVFDFRTFLNKIGFPLIRYWIESESN